MALIKSIDDLRKYVKIARSKDFDTYEPFIEDAQQRFLEPYVGFELLQNLESDNGNNLTNLLCRALGPFSLALASDELSINFGEAGHTVTRTDSLAPASETKIEKAKQSLMERGWANLDKALRYLAEHLADYEDWDISSLSVYRHSILFKDYQSFQTDGMVDIDLSPLTFHRLLPFIQRIEKTETILLLPESLRSTPAEELPVSLVPILQAYTASRVAAIHTSRLSRSQRAKPTYVVEFTPLIRPLYENPEDDANFYQSQASHFATAVTEELLKLSLIEKDTHALEWNEQDKKIFLANLS